MLKRFKCFVSVFLSRCATGLSATAEFSCYSQILFFCCSSWCCCHLRSRVADDGDDDLIRFHHQSLVEVKVLDALRRFDSDNKFNVIHMTDYFLFRSHLCIVFELMGYEYTVFMYSELYIPNITFYLVRDYKLTKRTS